MRRLFLQEPVSRASIWSLRVSCFALVLAAIAIVSIRADIMDLQAGLAVLVSSFVFALAAAGLAFTAFATIWRQGFQGLNGAVKGLLLASFMLAAPALMAFKYITLPSINDIATDLQELPAFSRSPTALAARKGSSPNDSSTRTRMLQREAYPEISPLFLDVTPEEALDLARKAAQTQGWQLVETVALTRTSPARLDAIAYSVLFRLPDDVTLRIKPRADGVRMDLRSVSRYGRHDFGVNAARIRAFWEEVSRLAQQA